MWCIGAITLAFLPRSSSTLDDIVSSARNSHSGREGLADAHNQHAAFPYRQGFLPSETSPSYVGQADDHLRQSNAPSYEFYQVATHRATSGSISPTHPLKDLPQEQISHSIGHHSYAPPRQSTSALDDLPNYTFHHAPGENTASHTRFTDDQRKALDTIADFLMLEEPSDPLQLYTTNSPGAAGYVTSAASSGSQFQNFPLPTKSPAELLQHKQYVGGDVSRPMLGSTTGSPPRAQAGNIPNSVASDDQSLHSFQDGFILGLRRRRLTTVSSRAKVGTAGPYKARKITTRLKATKPDNKDPDICVKASGGSQGTCRDGLAQPMTQQYSLVDLMSAACMYDSAARLQRDRGQRIDMIKKTVKKWLPVYTAASDSGMKKPEIEAKLALLFEQLWLMNLWLLTSFEFEFSAKTEILHHGQDDMMTWIVHQMSNPKGILPLGPHPHLPGESLKEYNLEGLFSSFLEAKRQTEPIIVKSQRKKDIPIETETAVACQLAVCILDTYYKSSNEKRYEEVFHAHQTLSKRLMRFTTAKRTRNLRGWMASLGAQYGKNLVPWSDEKSSLESEDFQWDERIEKKFLHIFQERLDEMKNKAEEQRIVERRFSWR